MRTLTSLLILVLVACADSAPPALVVGPVSFTEDQLLGLSPTRRNTLAHLVAFGLAVSDSTTDALGGPRVAEWADDRLLEILAAELTLERNGVSDAVLEARYLTDPDYELTVRHILFFSERWRTPDERAAAEAKANRALEQLREGADFAATAAALSEEPGAEGRQGLLTPGREGAWVDEFWAAASALDVGGISPVTETQYGFHILRLENRVVVPFAESRSRIARELAPRLEDPRAVLTAWMVDAGVPSGEATGAGRLLALEEAHRRGLAVPEGELRELARAWDDLTYRWTAALGFSYGLTPEGVAQAALGALARSAQGANIARDEVDAHAALLEARYPIRSGAEETGG